MKKLKLILFLMILNKNLISSTHYEHGVNFVDPAAYESARLHKEYKNKNTNGKVVTYIFGPSGGENPGDKQPIDEGIENNQIMFLVDIEKHPILEKKIKPYRKIFYLNLDLNKDKLPVNSNFNQNDTAIVIANNFYHMFGLYTKMHDHLNSLLRAYPVVNFFFTSRNIKSLLTNKTFEKGLLGTKSKIDSIMTRIINCLNLARANNISFIFSTKITSMEDLFCKKYGLLYASRCSIIKEFDNQYPLTNSENHILFYDFIINNQENIKSSLYKIYINETSETNIPQEYIEKLFNKKSFNINSLEIKNPKLNIVYHLIDSKEIILKSYELYELNDSTKINFCFDDFYKNEILKKKLEDEKAICEVVINIQYKNPELERLYLLEKLYSFVDWEKTTEKNIVFL
jgi:hypothetical protein